MLLLPPHTHMMLLAALVGAAALQSTLRRAPTRAQQVRRAAVSLAVHDEPPALEEPPHPDSEFPARNKPRPPSVACKNCRRLLDIASRPDAGRPIILDAIGRTYR